MLTPKSRPLLRCMVLFAMLASASACDDDALPSPLDASMEPVDVTDAGDDASAPAEDAGLRDAAAQSMDDAGPSDAAVTARDAGHQDAAVDGGVDAATALDGAVADGGPEFDGGLVHDASALDGGREPVVCGDGLLHTSEACDDGNLRDADGCSATCRREHAVYATSIPSWGAGAGEVELVQRVDGGLLVAVNTTLGADAVRMRRPYFVALDASGRALFFADFLLENASAFTFRVIPHPGDGSTRVVGTFDGRLTLPGTTVLSSPGQRVPFVASFDAQGNLAWATMLRHEPSLVGPTVLQAALHDDGALVLAGAFARDEIIGVGAASLAVPTSAAPGTARRFFVAELSEAGALAADTGFVANTTSRVNLTDLVLTSDRTVLTASSGAVATYTVATASGTPRVVETPSIVLGFDRSVRSLWHVSYAHTFTGAMGRRLPSGDASFTCLRSNGTLETLIVTPEGTTSLSKRGTLLGESSDGTRRLVSGYRNGRGAADGHDLTSPLLGLTRYAIAYDATGQSPWARNMASSSAGVLDLAPPAHFDDGSLLAATACPELLGDGAQAITPDGDICLARFAPDGALSWNRALAGSIAASALPPYRPSVVPLSDGEGVVLVEATGAVSYALGTDDARSWSAGQHLVRLGSDGVLLDGFTLAGVEAPVVHPLFDTRDNLPVVVLSVSSGDTTILPGDGAEETFTVAPQLSSALVVVKLRP